MGAWEGEAVHVPKTKRRQIGTNFTKLEGALNVSSDESSNLLNCIIHYSKFIIKLFKNEYF